MISCLFLSLSQAIVFFLNYTAEEHISKAELRLTDMADALQTDWIPLALQLGLTSTDINLIQSDYDLLSEQVSGLVKSLTLSLTNS
jgi:hypothetical protein